MPEEANELQLLQHQLNQQLLSGYTALAHKHATVSYALIVVLVAVLGAVGFGGYVGLKEYKSAMTHAEQVEAGFQSRLDAYQQQLEQDNRERARLEAQISSRDKEVAAQKQKIADITAPKDAIAAIQGQYKNQLQNPSVEQNGRVGFTVPDVNRFTQTKMDAQALAADVDDLQSEVESLKLDQAQGQQALAACQDTVKAYKKAAKKSKWQKFVSGMKIGGAIALSAFIGHAI